MIVVRLEFHLHTHDFTTSSMKWNYVIRDVINYKYLKEVGGFALAKANHLDKALQPGPPTLEFKNFEAKSGN